MWGLAECLHVLHSEKGARLPPRSAARLERGGRIALLAWGHLANLAAEACQARWQLKPNHHAFDEAIRESLRTGRNPS
eukprot:2305662-Alexandrium_andersonii.AAC.1